MGGEKTELLCELRIREDEISTLKNEINRNNKIMEKLKVKVGGFFLDSHFQNAFFSFKSLKATELNWTKNATT